MSSYLFSKKVREITGRPGRAISNFGHNLIDNFQSVDIIPRTIMGVPILISGAAVSCVGSMVAIGVINAASIYTWAFGSSGFAPERPDPKIINDERQKENLEKGRIHIAICGQTGSGKSSIANALRGIRNGQEGAACTGTTETTTSRATYPAHQSISSVNLHDIPGGGTRRTPADNYYRNQKLFLFDLLLVVHSDRLSQLDIEIVKNCIRIMQPFLIVRSKSDISVNSIVNDTDLDQEAAKVHHIKSCLAALRTEFSEADVPEDSITDLVDHCILINNQALRKCVLGESDSVINELDLVRFLTKFNPSFQQRRMWGQYWFKQVDGGKYFDEQYIGHIELPIEDKMVMVTNARILLIRSRQLTTEWDVPLTIIRLIVSEPNGIRVVMRGAENGPLIAVEDRSERAVLYQIIGVAVEAFNRRFRGG
ncbi:interferon-inducible GTPase-domain-containing protein [Diaporthe sp. PMI_573]|nr:interferon-inducible GTPase-domain-containing protein [Diaporthaceae sp. PMI_573]